MTDLLLMCAAGFLSGAVSAMGLGGGGFLIIYLTLFARFNLAQARGINLIFFLPCAAFSLFMHSKNGLIQKNTAKKLLPWGFAGAAAGTALAFFISVKLLNKLFGVFLLLLGAKNIYPPLLYYFKKLKYKFAKK